MADNYTFFGPLDGYVPQVQANLLVAFAKNPDKFKYQQYTDIRPVDLMQGYWRQLKSERAARVVNGSMDTYSWAAGAVNPAYNQTNKEQFEMKAYKTQRYAAADVIDDLTRDQLKKTGLDLLQETSSELASQMATIRTHRIITKLTTGANWGSFTDTCTAVAGGKLSAATTSNPYIRDLFTDVTSNIIKQTNGMVQKGDIVALMSPDLGKILFRTAEMLDFIKQQPGVLEIVKGEVPWDENYWLPGSLYGVKLLFEDSVELTTEQDDDLNVSRDYILDDDTVIFMTKKGGIQPNQSSALSTFAMFTYEDFKVETFYEQQNKRNLVWVTDNTDEQIVAPQSGFLVTACNH